MAKFLNTSAINYYLEELIKEASERLVLISPFLKLNDRVKELLEDKNRLKIDVRIVYGKSELQPLEIDWLKELTYVRTSFCKNLHAKCYLNENSCIITSLNLYEFSQVNNNEMGVFISRELDQEMYKDTYEESQRIIRISEEVRISLERVDSKRTESPNNHHKTRKIPSYKLADKHELKTPELLKKLTELGMLEKDDDGKDVLTEIGIKSGGEFKKRKKGEEYFLWPEDLSI